MTRIILFLSLFSLVTWTQPSHAQTTDSTETAVCPLPPYVESTPDALESRWGLADDALPNLPPIIDVLIPDDGTTFVIVAKEPDDVTPTLYGYAPQSGDLSVLVTPTILDALRTEDYAGGVILGTPNFIPNTHTLLFYTEIVPNNDGIYFEIPSDLWSLDADTGTLIQLLPFGEGGAFNVSPEGDHLVLYTLESIRVGNPDGTGLVEIYHGRVGLGGGEFIAWPQTVWTDAHTFRALLLDAPLTASDGGYGFSHPIQIG